MLDLAGGKGDTLLIPDGSLKLVQIRMSAMGLHDDRVLEALRVMIDPANRPLMVHCKQGADRTGALVALYRVVVQGWSKQKAVLEMKDGGYHHSELWLNMDYDVMKADVDALRRALGLADLAPRSPSSPRAPDAPCMNARTIAAISSAAVSSAKWPASRTWTSAFGTSRRYASGSDGSNERSYLPHSTRSRGCFSRIHACQFG